jgi:hypothetical protein
MINNSDKIKNYAITIFCISVTMFLIFYGIFLNNKIQVQKDLMFKVDAIYNEYMIVVKEQKNLQVEIQENAKSAADLFNGLINIFSARLLEQENLIAKSEADLMALDAISKVAETNPDLARIMSILNRNWIDRR